MMKAAQIKQYGGQDALQVAVDVPKPKAEAGQVVVKVHAAGLNPFDWKLREGVFKEFIPLQLPAILGGDLAGTVAEVGKGVTGFEVGQAVYGSANAAGGRGSYAEFVSAKASQLAPKPDSLNFVEAGALPLAGVSAYQALIDTIKLQRGQKILIHGGAGGIGSLAVQIAKHIGAHVATTASAKDADFVRQLGADEVIDYHSQDFSTLLKDFDAVFDTVGSETTLKSVQVLRPGGVLVSMAGQLDDELAQQRSIEFHHQSTQTTRERLDGLVKMVEAGALKVHIDKTFPFSDVAEALEYLKTGHPKGKVVIEVLAVA